MAHHAVFNDKVFASQRALDRLGVRAADALNGEFALLIEQQNRRQFIFEILRHQVGGDIGHFLFVVQADHLLHHFVDQAETTRPAFGFFTQTGVFDQPCQMAGDHDHQMFIVLTERFGARVFNDQYTDGLTAIFKRNDQHRTRTLVDRHKAFAGRIHNAAGAAFLQYSLDRMPRQRNTDDIHLAFEQAVVSQHAPITGAQEERDQLGVECA